MSKPSRSSSLRKMVFSISSSSTSRTLVAAIQVSYKTSRSFSSTGHGGDFCARTQYRVTRPHDPLMLRAEGRQHEGEVPGECREGRKYLKRYDRLAGTGMRR